jgi:hypothetical protein
LIADDSADDDGCFDKIHSAARGSPEQIVISGRAEITRATGLGNIERQIDVATVATYIVHVQLPQPRPAFLRIGRCR